MCFKLAIGNVRKSFKDYAIYFLTLLFGVCIFYVFNAIESQKAMMLVSEMQHTMIRNLSNLIAYLSVFIAIVLGFLIIYANNFLIKRRKKELGIYMTLGMEKRKISLILVIETFIIGLLSLFCGLILGIFLSQGLSIFTAKLFDVDMIAFKFTFSEKAFGQSILCFGIIYVIVMAFNIFTISKCKLIDLIYSDKKNEKPKIKKLWVSVVIFIVAIICLGISYYCITDNGLSKIDLQFHMTFIMGFLGTFLFFMSLSGFLLKTIQYGKSMYYKDLNMFILRQINSKINTNYISMTFICIMLAITIVSLSSGVAVNQCIRSELQEVTPYDISIGWQKQDNNIIGDIREELKKVGLDISKYASEAVEFNTYDTDISFKEIFKGLDMNNQYNYTKEVAYKNLKVVALSDYNTVIKMQGKEPIRLRHNQYALNCNRPDILSLMEEYLKKNKDLYYNDHLLENSYGKPLENVLYVHFIKEDAGTLIVPDDIINKSNILKRTLNFNFISPEIGETYSKDVDKIIEKLGQEKLKDVPIYAATKTLIYEASVGTAATMTFLTIYISIVFLLTSAAILALAQLTEASDNKIRYRLLFKLGADASITNKALFRQIMIYFITPLILAIIHGIVGISVANKVLIVYGGMSVLPSIIFTTVVFVIIYGGYFLATYFGSKNIINAVNK